MKTLLCLLSAVVLSGCSALGKDTFDCPNKFVGSACMSAKEVYGATHVADEVKRGFKDGKPIEPEDEHGAAGTPADKQRVAGMQAANEYRPPLPELDTPLPVRMPAKVMRIRVFPWEDNNKDLNTGGYIYTEVEGRTWSIGEEQVARVQANITSPLNAPRTVPSTREPMAAPKPAGAR